LLKTEFLRQIFVLDSSLEGSNPEIGSNVSLFRNESFFRKLGSRSSLTRTSHALRGQKTHARPNTIFPRSTQHYKRLNSTTTFDWSNSDSFKNWFRMLANLVLAANSKLVFVSSPPASSSLTKRTTTLPTSTLRGHR
jgi:hypothetical protein